MVLKFHAWEKTFREKKYLKVSLRKVNNIIKVDTYSLRFIHVLSFYNPWWMATCNALLFKTETRSSQKSNHSYTLKVSLCIIPACIPLEKANHKPNIKRGKKVYSGYSRRKPCKFTMQRVWICNYIVNMNRELDTIIQSTTYEFWNSRMSINNLKSCQTFAQVFE